MFVNLGVKFPSDLDNGTNITEEYANSKSFEP